MKNRSSKKIAAMILSFAVMATAACASVSAADTDAASVGETKYATLQEAINATDNKEITLLKDVAESVEIEAGKTVILNLNGKKITNAAGKHTITNKGTLTVNGEGTVDNISHGKGALVNSKGTVVINGGTFTRSAEAGKIEVQPDGTEKRVNGGNSWYVIDNNGGTMTFNGGKVTSTSKFSSLLRNLGAELTINQGEFVSDFITLKNDDNGVIKMSGGKVSTNYKGGSAIQNWGSLTVTGGELSATDDAAAIAAYSWDDQYDSKASVNGEVTINGAILSAKDADYPDQEKAPLLVIDKATVNGDVVAERDGKIEINGGTYTGALSIPETDGGSIAVTAGTFAEKPDDSMIKASAVAKVTENKNTNYYLGDTASVEKAVQTVSAGGAVEIFKGDVNLSLVDNVTVKNSGTGTVIVNTVTVESGKEIVTKTESNPESSTESRTESQPQADTSSVSSTASSAETGVENMVALCVVLLAVSLCAVGAVIYKRKEQ